MNEFIAKPLSFRESFCVDNDDHGYFPASRDGKEGMDIRIRGVQWPGKDGALDGIFDTPMPGLALESYKIIFGNLRNHQTAK